MLVIGRRPGQTILAGQTRITILDIRPNGHVRIGLEGPDEVDFIREELLERGPWQKRQKEVKGETPELLTPDS